MCGITGIWHLDGTTVDKDKIQRFNNSLSHRGPDGDGVLGLDEDRLFLGHRRLSILDLSELGAQPMTYADGQLVMTFNGEIFNFLELRSLLAADGYTFRSDSDSEVALAAYHKWGKSCFERFNGMWAMAIWDNRTKELVLSRDRFGIKPLYYTNPQNDVFAFASETYAFRYLEGFHRQLDDMMVNLSMTDEYAIEGLGYTIFQDVFQILPGHIAVIKSDNNFIHQKRWYSINAAAPQVPKEYTEQVDEFYRLFEDSCKLRLQSDVPLATALSGGLDSSSVFSVVSSILNNNIGHRVNQNSQKAYTVTFPYLKSDEYQYAKRAAGFLNKEAIPINSDIKNLGNAIYGQTRKADYIGKPLAALSSVYKGMKADGISVSMDGHGVDEMLYGYRDMVYGLYNHSLYTPSKDPRELSRVLLNMYHEEDRAGAAKRFQVDYAQEKSSIGRAKRWAKQIVSSKSVPGYGEFLPVDLPSLSDEPYKFDNMAYPDRMLYHEFFEHTLPSLLRNFDRAGMQNSVEIRMPFMDYRLVEYVFKLPFQAKIGKGFTKLILRDAMKGKIHEEIRTRTYKVGIASPVEYWFNHELNEWMMDLVDDKMRAKIYRQSKSGGLSKQDITDAWTSINYKILAEK